MLYISDVPFEMLGFRTDVTTREVPGYTWDVMTKIPPVVGDDGRGADRRGGADPPAERPPRRHAAVGTGRGRPRPNETGATPLTMRPLTMSARR